MWELLLLASRLGPVAARSTVYGQFEVSERKYEKVEQYKNY